MADNTIMTAKNSFSEGLLMDFSPDNTQANCMTSALNATLLTFNGNEMSLQNDMGNGRVETAFLPEGYVPVGTCEFGDIVYIVSYNPFIDKALIGCFPSPERNISSEELGMEPQTVSCSEFQELDENGNPTGNIKASSIKKILFKNDMHPGDQYIIYSENTDWGQFISDYGNSGYSKGSFPKFVKISIVSIEESGKITYIDSNVKWYDSNNYYILDDMKAGSTGKLDLDSYRSMVSSAYSTFSSKISGKLSLLIELEKITGFSCSWDSYIPEYNYNGWIKVSDSYSSILDYIKNNSTERTPNQLINSFKANPSNYIWVWTQSKSPVVGEKNIKFEDEIKIENYTTINKSDSENISETVKKGTVINNYTVKCNYIRINNEIYMDVDRQYSVENGYVDGDGIQYKNYNIKFNFGWKTENKNINPKYVVIDKFNWIGSNVYKYYDQNMNECQKTFANLPVKQGDYFTFNLLYNPDTYTGTYDDFINRDCYEKKSEYVLEEILKNYYDSKINSIKLNFNSNTGLPIPGSYYVNINDVTDGVIYNLNKSGNRVESVPHEISDDIINNSLKLPVEKLLPGNITLPVKGIINEVEYDLDRNNLIVDYTLTPAMGYGKLEEYSISGQIDFSKIGTTNINLKKWKYYNYDNSITLTWGMDAYTEPDKDIPEVIFEFYDSQGIAAVYHAKNYSSYNGTFTEYIILNSNTANSNLNNIDWKGNEIFHLKRETTAPNLQYQTQYYYKDLGNYLKIDSLYFYADKGVGKNEVNVNTHDFTRPCYIKVNNKEYEITSNSKFYESDAGTLYSNWLYGVKIIVKYEYKNILGEYIANDNPILYTRWLWTNKIFNEHYVSIDDYINLNFSLNLDMDVKYTTTNDWKLDTYDYRSSNLNSENNLSDFEKRAAIVLSVNGDGSKENINLKVIPGLVDNYDTFTLCSQKTKPDGSIDYPLKNIYAEIILGLQDVTNYPEQVEIFSHSGNEYNLQKSELQPTFDSNFEGVCQNLGKNLYENIGCPSWITSVKNSELYEANSDYGYENLNNSFKITNDKYVNLYIDESSIIPVKAGLSKIKIL